ncbi:uncharacterized protein [Eleutherodactylus coqui]|uniref:uncharacterized protein n=1 Tax=Eleutherodactylus coqui TaxID=57060 RepID=UPI003462FD62
MSLLHVAQRKYSLNMERHERLRAADPEKGIIERARILRLRRSYRRKLLLLVVLMQNQNPKKTERASRRYWVHPLLSESGTKGHFASLFQDLKNHPEKFVQFCRLPMEAFERLLELVRRDITYEDTQMREAITAEERLLITLRFLATGESYASLHLQFRVVKSTIIKIVRCTCSIIWQKLQPIVMPSPSEETWHRVAAGFLTVAKFPNCLGAVDGKHVHVLQPAHSGSKF